MHNLLGEYDCKVDAKGRFMFPSSFRKMMGDEVQKGFVLNRSTDAEALVLYPNDLWEKITKRLKKLNRFDKRVNKAVRIMLSGATPIEVDSAGRMLLPKSLVGYAGIAKDLKVVGSVDRFELWDREKYENYLRVERESEAAADVISDTLGSIDFDEE